MPWSDVCDVFDGIYISWDPSLFGKELEFHGCVLVSAAAPMQYHLISDCAQDVEAKECGG